MTEGPGFDRVGPYRIIELLNRGGAGRVYLGYDDRLHRPVAIKLLARRPSKRDSKRLIQEARTAAALDSQYLVKLYDVVASAKHLSLVMEYVSGCDLEQLLKVTTLSQASILAVASDLSAALAALRRHGIVHGDIKPANVLITRDGRAKLTDFGIARHDSVTVPPAAGSPSALSPEHLRGESLDVRADLFALGCLLYRMLSGEHPFFYKGELDAQRLLLAAPAAPRVAADGTPIDPQLRRLVDSLLSVSPDSRPANTHEVRRVLRIARRSLPLGPGRTLQTEARPWFSHEKAGLAASGASAYSNAAVSDLATQDAGSSVLRPRPRANVWLVGISALFAIGLLLLGTAWYPAPSVQVAEPIVRLVAGIAAPQSITADWLRGEVVATARQAWPRAIFTDGEPGAVTTLSTQAQPMVETWDEKLGIALRCSVDFCLLELVRDSEDTSWRQQATLLPGDDLNQWRSVVRSATVALYKQ